MPFEKISHKITVSIVGVTLTFVFVFGVASFWYSRTTIIEQVSKRIHYNANAFQAQLESYLTDLKHDIESMSKNLLLSNALVDSEGRELYIDPFLKGYAPSINVPFQLTLLDFEGNTIAPLPRTQAKKQPYLKELLATTISRERPYASVSQIDGTSYLNLAYPIFYGATGMAEGVLFLEISLSGIFSQLTTEYQSTGYYLLGLNQGSQQLIGYGVKKENNFYSVNNPLNLSPALQSLQLNINYGESLDQALAPLKKITLIYLFCAIFIFFATTIISRWIAKKIATPIISLSEVANNIAKTGSLSAEINTGGTGEVGVLAKSFKKMLSRLSDAHSTLEMQVEERTKDLMLEIAERIKTEEALKQAKVEWEKTFNAMNDIITIQDKNMCIVRGNTKFYDTFKATLPELENKYCYEVFRKSRRPCLNCPELVTLAKKISYSENITHENLKKIFHVTSSPIFDDDGEVANIVHVAKDITEKKKMEDELFQAHKMEAIGTLAGGIAHDFNNILAAIIGYADMAKDDLPALSHSRNCIDQVLKAGNRAKELVRQILTFSRKGPETLQPLQPSSIIKEGLKLMRASLPTTIEIREKIDPDCASILANPTNIHQILVNLCTNALHAMEDEKGLLTVTLHQVKLREIDLTLEIGISAGTFVELMVSDTGCGIDEAILERIFEPYFTTKEIGKGSGMGLALVHGIVQGCGGFVKVESRLGKGSIFHIYFPAVDEKPVADKEEKQKRIPTGNERILAVDDEEIIVNMHKTILEKLGYKVTVHTSSKHTFEEFQASPDKFDLILTDQTMPDIDGSELAKKILQIRPDIPIIMCTGYSTMISEEQTKEIGIKKFLMKPVDRMDLALMIRDVLDEKKSDSLLAAGI